MVAVEFDVLGMMKDARKMLRRNDIETLRARVAELEAQYETACKVVAKCHAERNAAYRDEHAALLRVKELEAEAVQRERRIIEAYEDRNRHLGDELLAQKKVRILQAAIAAKDAALKPLADLPLRPIQWTDDEADLTLVRISWIKAARAALKPQEG
jgi:hypothetical protein